jgi:hypothetical protein
MAIGESGVKFMETSDQIKLGRSSIRVSDNCMIALNGAMKILLVIFILFRDLGQLEGI